MEGRILDSLLCPKALDIIAIGGASPYPSRAKIRVTAPDEIQLKGSMAKKHGAKDYIRIFLL